MKERFSIERRAGVAAGAFALAVFFGCAWLVSYGKAPGDAGDATESAVKTAEVNDAKHSPAGSLYVDSLTNKPIPSSWFLERKLPLNDPAVCLQDPDGNGFPNEVEWRWKTDPNDKSSHPPYYAMLFLKQMNRIPFRLKFSRYNGIPAKDGRDFEIEKIDEHQPAEFLKMGDIISGTSYKLINLEIKFVKNANTGENDDRSELTVVNTETNDRSILILNRIVDCPHFYARFDYQWPQPDQPPLKPMEFMVKKSGSFVLIPNVKDVYKLIDIREDAAVIQLPAGQTAPDGSHTVEIRRDPRKLRKPKSQGSDKGRSSPGAKPAE